MKTVNYKFTLCETLTDFGNVYGFVCAGSDGSLYVIRDISANLFFVIGIIDLFNEDQPKPVQAEYLLQDLLP